MASARRSSARRLTQARPVNERSTPRKCRAPSPNAAPVLLELLDRGMQRLDPANGAGGGAHHDRMGGDAAAHMADAFEHGAVGNARGGENHVSRSHFLHAELL